MKISFLTCYRAADGKTNFFSPAAEFLHTELRGAAGIGSKNQWGTFLGTDAGPYTAKIVPYTRFGETLVVGAKDNSVIGADYLSPAHNDVNFPGAWSVNFNLYVPLNPTPTNGVPAGSNGLVRICVAFPSVVAGGSLSLNDLDFPWPLPLVSDISTAKGLGFVDQFGDPYPAFTTGFPVYSSTGPLPYSDASPYGVPGYAALDPVVGPPANNDLVIPCSLGHVYGPSTVELFIEDAPALPSGSKPLAYPSFTWDSARMNAIVGWFDQYPCKLVYRVGATFVAVDGRLGIDPNLISYGPVHFSLNRPQCKFAGILNACS